eukprot:403362163
MTNWSSTHIQNNIAGTQPVNSMLTQNPKSQSTSNLPPLKETNKFSSWADKSLFDQVDELLGDQENTSSQKRANTQVSIGNGYQKDLILSKNTSKQDINFNQSQKESLLSLSGSLDLDSYEIDDEVQNPQKLNSQFNNNTNIKVNVYSKSSLQNNGASQVLSDRRSSRNNSIPQELDEDIEDDQKLLDDPYNLSSSGGEPIGDSLDLDNSDDLNKIIQKYENMLVNPQSAKQKQNQQVDENNNKSINSAKSLEESWGASEFLNNQPSTSKTSANTSNILKRRNSNKSSGNVKSQDEEEEQYDEDDFEHQDDDDFNNLENSQEDDDHLVDEEIYMNSSVGKKDSQYLQELLNQPLRTKQSATQKDNSAGRTAAQKIVAQLEGSGEYSDDIDEFIKKHIEDEELNNSKDQQKTNSQVNAKASNTSNSSSSDSSSDQDEVFEDDKRTPKEVLMDELKKLADIFGKYSLTDREMFLSDLENILKIISYEEVQTHKDQQDAVDLLNIQLFPLISKMMINSEEQVQNEAVDALLKVSKEYLTIKDAQYLMFDLAQSIMKKVEQSEGAKISVLMLVERFSEEKIFTEYQCLIFLDDFLPDIQRGMLFKIKKFLLPCLISVSKNIAYEKFLEVVYPIFIKFTQDDIWGVKKVCVEKLQDFVKLIKSNELQKLQQCVFFLQLCLNDSSRWVKNQAFQQYGYILHEIYLKMLEVDDQHIKMQLQSFIHNSFNIFYDMKYIQSGDEDQSICQSFMGNQNDDIDKVKYCWAFYIGCALTINGGQTYWETKLRSIYQKLYKDILLNVKKSLASSLVEIVKLVDIESQENQQFFLEVLNHFLGDIEEIKSKLTPELCKFIAVYPSEQHNHLVSTFIREQLQNIQPKQRDAKIQLLEQIYNLFTPQFLADQEFHLSLQEIIDKDQAISYKKRACKLFGAKVVAPLIKTKKLRKTLTSFLDNLRISKNFRQRQLYLIIARQTYASDNEIFKKHFAKSIGNEMVEEKDEQYRKRQFLNFEDKEEEIKKDEDSVKDQEALEKSVNIRFANFSMLQRSGTSGSTNEFGSLFSSQLMALIGGMLGSSSGSSDNKSEMLDKSEEAIMKSNSSGAGQWLQ